MAKKKQYQWDAAIQDTGDVPPSRSQKKRDSTALQALGEELIRVPLARLHTLPLTDDLREALELMTSIRGHEGRRRQRQYIGRLMRECDAQAIRTAMEVKRQGSS